MSTSDLKFQPFYCEENIWQLCQHPDYLNGEVVFISSLGDYFPMLCQQGSGSPSTPIFWDYHVVLLRNGYIHDFNTTLPFSTGVTDYFAQSFIDESLLNPVQVPLFRIIPAKEFISTFKSDRRHMKADDGWNAPPPEWPLISESSSNLNQFTDMRNTEFGQILSRSQFLESKA